MDRDPLGWTVERHVVDVAWDEVDLRPAVVVRHLVLVPPVPGTPRRESETLAWAGQPPVP